MEKYASDQPHSQALVPPLHKSLGTWNASAVIPSFSCPFVVFVSASDSMYLSLFTSQTVEFEVHKLNA